MSAVEVTEKQSSESTDRRRSKETPVTSSTGAASNSSDSGFEPRWKPNLDTREEKLAKIKVPESYPCERVFDDYLARTDSPNPDYRPELYAQLCNEKWHQWKDHLKKWVKIKNWQRYVDVLGETIDGAKRGEK